MNWEGEKAMAPARADWLTGGGEMGKLIREMDWSRTTLGPIESWPQSLRSSVSMLLPSKAQIILFWGPSLVAIYNDTYREIFGTKHPWALGQPASKCWSEIWDVLRPLLEGVVTTGEAFWAKDHPFSVERRGYTEETYFDISYDPVRDETGKVGGVFCIVRETTGRVLGERRLQTLRDLAARSAEARTQEEACQLAAETLAANAYDIPFALLYLLDPTGARAQLAGAAGIAVDTVASPRQIALAQAGDSLCGWPFAEVMGDRRSRVVDDLSQRFGLTGTKLPGGSWPESPKQAVMAPLARAGQEQSSSPPAGFLIAGVSPRRAFDDEYQGFFALVAGQVTTAIANARAYEEERQRAEALAEIDRAKTAFFSNVSHEFRTPLTLMLGPIEDTLAEDQLPSRAHGRLEVAYRNSLRLLKLVNALLDFSRIEAGRIQAVYETQSVDAMNAALPISPSALPFVFPARILLADDNSDMREYVRRLLATNYEVEAVADGEAALQAARERPPDLIFSDVMMPKLDGFGLLKALREDGRLATIPVILLSARAGEEARVEGLEAGADDYLIKPFSARELLARVRAHLEMTRLRREAEMALRHSEKRFRELANNAPIIIWMTDDQGNNEFVNKAYQSFFGVAPEEVAERRWMELVHPDDYETYVQKFLDVSAARLPFRAEARVRRADGEWRWLDSYAIPRAMESGHKSGMIGCSADITERKQSEDAMGQLAAIVESSDDGIISKDLNGVIMSWNKGAEKLFGYAAEEVIGKSIMIVVPPDRADEETRVLESIRRGEKIDHYETVRRRKDGALVEISLTVSPLRDKAGAVIGGAKIARDITERKRVEQALAEGARQQRALYQLADHLHRARSLDDVYNATLDAILSALRCDRAAISLLDDAGVMRFAGWRGLSDGYRKAVEGYSSWKSDERCLEPICINDVDLAEIEESLKAVVKREGIGALAFIPLVSRGKLVGKFMTYFNAPHVFSDGELALSLTIARQLAFGIDRKRAEKLLRQNAAQLALITNTAPVFIAHCDAQARFKFVNKAYAERFGLTPEDCIGKRVPEVVGEEAYRSFDQHVEAALRGEPVEFEVEIPYEVIGRRFMHCSYAPEFDADGKVVGFVAAITDISARKRAEEKIARLLAEEQEARDVAEQATRAKDEFLALVSHELRSPLNAILGYTRMLRSGARDREDFNKVTGVIERSAKAQLQIVEDLLDSARIVTGKLRIEPSLVDLVPALEAALDTVRSAAEAKGITLVADFGHLPELVLGDSTRLQQVVWNLLTNAVKFTPEGGRVELRMEGDAGHIRIAVIDTGKGVEPDFLPFVFDRFRQADASSGRRYGGVGLGLSLVKHLVELHGGTITAASDGAGRGTTFTITLPRRHLELIPSAPPAVTSREVRTEGVIPKDQALSLKGVSVLVVDDQEEARVILTEELSKYGAQVTTVSSGTEALAILSLPPDERRPDVLIMDIAMPDEDGYAVLKKVRALEAERGAVAPQIPAIALTAHARVEDRLRALNAGFQMHVAKPVEPTELAVVIISLIKRFDIKPGS